jgi:ribonuclease PH
MRIDHRQPNQLRPLKITTDYLLTAEGSVLIEVGNTQVLCAASIEDSVPHFLRNSGKGWVTAEYSMLPRATAKRTGRAQRHPRLRRPASRRRHPHRRHHRRLHRSVHGHP